MQLLEYITQRAKENELYLQRTIKIGAQSGYFYCGTVKNFLNNMDVYDTSIRSFFSRHAIKEKKTYENYLNNPPTLSEFAESVLSNGCEFDLRDYEENVLRWFSMVHKRRDMKNEAEEKRDTTKNLSVREVKEHRMANPLVEEDIEVIIIEGYEIGRIWMANEVENYGEFTISDAEENDGDAHSGNDESDGTGI